VFQDCSPAVQQPYTALPVPLRFTLEAMEHESDTPTTLSLNLSYCLTWLETHAEAPQQAEIGICHHEAVQLTVQHLSKPFCGIVVTRELFESGFRVQRCGQCSVPRWLISSERVVHLQARWARDDVTIRSRLWSSGESLTCA
jgi:hypothetical protein